MTENMNYELSEEEVAALLAEDDAQIEREVERGKKHSSKQSKHHKLLLAYINIVPLLIGGMGFFLGYQKNQITQEEIKKAVAEARLQTISALVSNYSPIKEEARKLYSTKKNIETKTPETPQGNLEERAVAPVRNYWDGKELLNLLGFKGIISNPELAAQDEDGIVYARFNTTWDILMQVIANPWEHKIVGKDEKLYSTLEEAKKGAKKYVIEFQDGKDGKIYNIYDARTNEVFGF